MRKRPHVNPEAVVKVAMELLDAEGMEGVTFRAVAKKLGVQPPALYWHFVNKRDLMDDLAQAILVQGGVGAIVPPTKPSEWRGWLAQMGRTVRSALVAHTDGGRVVAGASFHRAKALARLSVTSAQVLRDAGFGLAEAVMATTTVIDYVWGFVIEEQEGTGPEPKDEDSSPGADDPTRAPDFLAMAFGVELAMAPQVQAMMEEWDRLSDAQKFEWGLQTILEGLAASKRSGRRAKPSTTA
ncbi:MAG: TetR/AcrR family transcriptional regulator C-terminal domain-containing protein [Thermoplasmata archaeon]